MTKRNNIIYWIATIWLSFGMAFTGVAQLMQTEADVELMTRLGYPHYFLPMLGTWKLLGVAAVLVPGFLLLKEWTYAGFFFAMSGAVISHLIIGSPVTDLIGPLLLIVLTLTSWYFRPANRRLVAVGQQKAIA